jgi:hypothetical protein
VWTAVVWDVHVLFLWILISNCAVFTLLDNTLRHFTGRQSAMYFDPFICIHLFQDVHSCESISCSYWLRLLWVWASFPSRDGSMIPAVFSMLFLSLSIVCAQLLQCLFTRPDGKHIHKFKFASMKQTAHKQSFSQTFHIVMLDVCSATVDIAGRTFLELCTPFSLAKSVWLL